MTTKVLILFLILTQEIRDFSSEYPLPSLVAFNQGIFRQENLVRKCADLIQI